MSVIGAGVMSRGALSCHRCRGLMVCDHVADVERLLSIVRCLNCGEIVDERILENRKMMKLQAAAAA